jgi:hypothetical protein
MDGWNIGPAPYTGVGAHDHEVGHPGSDVTFTLCGPEPGKWQGTFDAIWRLTGPAPRRLMQGLPRAVAVPGTAWTGRS